MTGRHVLLVEDDQDIRDLVEYNLLKEGFRVTSVASGEEAVEVARARTPDLVVLDLMLPGIDGLEVCRILKRDPGTEHVPVLMLTAKGEESDIVAGLELGADDYVTKPFSRKVLVARIRAVLRRRSRGAGLPDSIIRVSDLVIDPGRHEARLGDRVLDLTYTEFRVLQLLAGQPGWVFTRYQIVNGIRGEDYPVTDRAVDVQIVGLRKKLGDAAHHIETVRGVGYRFKE
jgi:two-component system alkaline phosphatase synthesis response regulator PhoP